MNKLWKIVPVGIILFFCLVLAKSIEITSNNGISLLIATIILIVFVLLNDKLKWKEKINSIQQNKINKIFFIIIGIHAIIMFVFSLVLISSPGSDLGTIYHSALEIVETGHVNTEIDENTSCYKFYKYSNNDYFNNCQNNIMLLIILTILYGFMKAIGVALTVESTLIVSHILNIICIESAIFIGIKILCKKYNNYTGLIYLILSCLFIPYYINSFRFYTDTIVMPFIMLMLYLFEKIEDNPTQKQLWLLLAVVSFIAIKIKQSAAIVLIAIFVYYIFKLNKTKLLKFATIVLPICLILSFTFNFCVRNLNFISFENEEYVKFPTIHWIALGMTGNGSYNQMIVHLELMYKSTVEEKEKVVYKILKRELSQYNVTEFIDFELTKAVNTWADGKYYQQSHMSWYHNETILQEFLLADGEYYEEFNILLKAYSFFMILVFIVNAVVSLKNRECSKEIVMQLIILGLAVFLSVWETKSRYLLSFIPVFFSLIAYSLNKFKIRW